jgi:hypothetical protein
MLGMCSGAAVSPSSWKPARQFAEGKLRLHARQLGPEAGVSAMAEGERTRTKPSPVKVGEDFLVGPTAARRSPILPAHRG